MAEPFTACSVQGCERNAHWKSHGAKGMCSAHYQRVRIHGDVDANFKTKPDFIACSVEGCSRNAKTNKGGRNGMCEMHWKRVKKHGDPSYEWDKPSPAMDWLTAYASHTGDSCLKWPFHIGRDGYGRVHRPRTSKLSTASNMMCELAHGPAPSKKHQAAHSCGNGNRGCVNPMHLRWATHTENQADRALHGTHNRGERQGSSRLTELDVKRIRELAENLTQAEIALAYGVDQSHINRIIHREVWSWLE